MVSAGKLATASIALAAALGACELVYTFDRGVVGATDGAAPPDASATDSTVPTDASDGSATDTSTLDGCPQYPTPTLLYQEQPNARALQCDDASLYWLVAGDGGGAVVRGDKTGGDASVLVADAGGTPVTLALDDTRVYWSTSAGDLLAAPKTGGATVSLVNAADGGISSIAVDATGVYYVLPAGLTIERLPLDGGSPTRIGSGTPNASQGEEARVGPTNVYWSDVSNIYSAPKDTDGSTSPVIVVFDKSDPYALKGFAVDSTSVFFTYFYLDSYHANGLYRQAVDGGDASVLDPSAQVYLPTLDDASVYYRSEGVRPGFYVVPKAGGAQCFITTRVFARNAGPVVDDQSIYWIEGAQDGTTTIAKVPKL